MSDNDQQVSHADRTAALQAQQDKAMAMRLAITTYRSDINPDLIPAALKDMRVWVCWMALPTTDREGMPKMRKMPVQPFGRGAAAADDSSTWSSFDECYAAYLSNPGIAGLGVELGLQEREAVDGKPALTYTPSGVTGCDWDVSADFDGPRDWLGVPEEFAHLIYATGSYVEISPSGRGFRQLIFGTVKPGYGSMNKKFAPGIDLEMYDCGRFLTITTNVLRDPESGAVLYPELLENQDMIDHIQETCLPKREVKPAAGEGSGLRGCSELLTDKSVLELLAIARKSDDTFGPLYDEGIHPTTSNRNEMDASLCGKLVFWLHTVERVDAAFRASALMRDKWTERRGGRTYGEMTITYAMNTNEGRYTGFVDRTTTIESYAAVRSLIIDVITQINGSAGTRATYKRLADSVLSMIAEARFEKDDAGIRLTVGGLDGLCALNGGDRSNLRQRLEFLCELGLLGGLRNPEVRGHAYQVLLPADGRLLVGLREGLQPGVTFPVLASSRKASEKRAAQVAAGTLPARKEGPRAAPRPPTLHRCRYVAEAVWGRHTATIAELVADTRESAGTARRCVRVLVEGAYVQRLPGHRVMATSGAQGRFTLALAEEFERLRREPARARARRAARYFRTKIDFFQADRPDLAAVWQERLARAEAQLQRLEAGEPIRQVLAS